jgi:hypothetical protein
MGSEFADGSILATSSAMGFLGECVEHVRKQSMAKRKDSRNRPTEIGRAEGSILERISAARRQHNESDASTYQNEEAKL